MIITSTQNPFIKEIIALRDSKERRSKGLALIDGVRESQRALTCGIIIEKVFFCPKLFNHPIDIQKLFGKKTQLIEVGHKVFEKIAYGERHDGVVSVAKVFQNNLKDLELPANPFIVIIESVEKPGNLGAIIRTCDGVGIDALLICDPKTDVYNPNVIRASTGTVFKIPAVILSKEEAVAFLKKKGIKALGMYPEAKDIYSKSNLKGPLAIVLGAEDEGLSPFWHKQCDIKVKIPMNGLADSLNVSVSAAIVLYEALRQRTA